MPVKDHRRKGGSSNATFYKWRAKYGGMDVPNAQTAA
jgi:putative transposase